MQIIFSAFLTGNKPCPFDEQYSQHFSKLISGLAETSVRFEFMIAKEEAIVMKSNGLATVSV